MSKVTDGLNRFVIGLGLAILLGAGAEAAPVVSYSPPGLSASDGLVVKAGVYRRSARRTARRTVRRHVR
jgi:hypothetical protein